MHRHLNRRGITNVLLIAGIVGLVGVTLILTPAFGYERYSDGCDTCHGDFRDDVSPQGSIFFFGGDKHDMHHLGQLMDADCNLCHGGLGEDYLASSAGTANNPGVGCLGCHGQDYGGEIGFSGVGLRAHHVNAGAADCATCHEGDPTPLSEATMPVYYGTVDTNCDDPCNSGPDLLENYTVNNPEGLDNDGDLLYDDADPDCSGDTCPWDTAPDGGDGTVGLGDLNALLSNWGTCAPPCLWDFAPEGGDGTVGLGDLNALLSNWGPCP